MNELASVDPYGAMSGPDSLKFQRLLPGPIEHTWAYLTDNDLRRQWLAAGHLGMNVGAPVEFVWRNDELSNPASQRPAGFPEEQRMQGRITAFESARKLAIAWDGFGEVSYELSRENEHVLLTMTQRGLPNRDIVVMFAAGSHVHLDILAARMGGGEIEPFWAGWTRLRAEYDRRLSS